MTFPLLKRDPTTRELRQFAGSSLIALPLITWIALGQPRPAGWSATSLPYPFWTTAHSAWIAGMAGVGLLLTLLSFAAPGIIRPIYRGVMLITRPIGLVVSELVLLAIFAVVFTPVGLLFRLIGRDVLARRIDREATTYWRVRAKSPAPESYFRQS